MTSLQWTKLIWSKAPEKLDPGDIPEKVIYRFLNTNAPIIDVPIFILLLWEGRKLLENVSIFFKFANINIEIGTKTTPLNKRIFLESLARQLKMAKRH